MPTWFERMSAAPAAQASSAAASDEQRVGGSRITAPPPRAPQDLYSAFMAGLSPELRILSATPRERREMIEGAPPPQRTSLFQALPPREAEALLFEIDVTDQERITVLTASPAIAAVLTYQHAWPLMDQRLGPIGAQRRVFARLPLTERMQILAILGPDHAREVYPEPNDAQVGEHAALLSAMSDLAIEEMLGPKDDEWLRMLIMSVPPHVRERVRRLLEVTHPYLAEERSGRTDEELAEPIAEVGAGVVARRAHLSHGEMPTAEDWAAMPRDGRVDVFRDASVTRRLQYLAVEPEGRARMLRELGGGELVDTMAGCLHKASLDELVKQVHADELTLAMTGTPDAAAVAKIFPHLTEAQRTAVLPAMPPESVGAILAIGSDATRDDVWWMVRDLLPPETVTAALRRLSDEQIQDLYWKLLPDGQEQLVALLPSARRFLVAPRSAAE